MDNSRVILFLHNLGRFFHNSSTSGFTQLRILSQPVFMAWVTKNINYKHVITQVWRTLWIKKTRPGTIQGPGGVSSWDGCSVSRTRSLRNATSCLNNLGQLLNFIVGIPIFCHFFPDLPVRIHHSGVIFTAEGFANLGQRVIG